MPGSDAHCISPAPPQRLSVSSLAAKVKLSSSKGPGELAQTDTARKAPRELLKRIRQPQARERSRIHRAVLGGRTRFDRFPP